MYNFPVPDSLEKLRGYLELLEKIRNTPHELDQVCHHIVPRCLGGSEEEANKIRISHQSHYELHQLLALAYPSVRGLVYAAYMMSKRNTITAEEYSALQTRFCEIQSESMSSMNKTYTYIHNEDEELYVRKCEVPVYESLGYTLGMSKSHRERIGDSHRGLSKSDDTKRRISESNQGKHKGKIWVNNGETQCTIPPESFPEYERIGYIRGRLPFSESHIENLKKPKSPSHRESISNNMLKRWKDPEYREKMKPILSQNAKSRYKESCEL